MKKKFIPILLLALAFNSIDVAQARGNKGNRLVTRLSQALGFSLRSEKVGTSMQLLLTTALACTMLACGSIKPILYNTGVLNPSSAMRAEVIADAVLTAQRDFDHHEKGEKIIRNHVYAHKPTDFAYKIVLAEVLKDGEHSLTLQVYADKYELTTSPDAIKGYLIDDHPRVGSRIKLSTEVVGFSHLNGIVIAVYDDGMLAVKITSKTDFDGQQEELHSKKDAPHIRFAYEHPQQ